MLSYQTHFSRRKTCTQNLLSLQGNATFDQAEELQKVLSRALHSCDQLVIDLQGVREVDISFIMILCAVHRTAELLGKRVSVRGALPELFKRHFEYARYSRQRGCLFSARKHCRFWKHLNNIQPESRPMREAA